MDDIPRLNSEENEDFFNQKIEIIVLENFNPDDLAKIQEAHRILENLQGEGFGQSLKIYKKIQKFVQELKAKYTEEVLENFVLYRILVNQSINDDAEKLDLDEDDSILNFLKNCKKEFNF